MINRLIVALILLLTVLSTITSFSKTSAESNQDTDQIIVKFKKNVPSSEKQKIYNSLKVKPAQKIEKLNSEAIKIPKGKAADFVKILAKNPLVEYAEPDFLAEKLQDPNDPYFSSQWGLQKIQASGAWDQTLGDNVDIAILDTGIDQSHPDLAGKVSKRANFTIDGDFDGDGHGTHVGGIASAITNNGTGVAGLGYRARLFSVKVLDNTGSGYYSWISNGLIWAADNGAEVVNLSLGGSSSSTTLKNAIDYAWNKGVVIAAAAGNRGNSFPTYPAYYSQSIAVAATDSADKRASFSSYGSWVDVAAPGVSIISTVPPNSYESWSGTSMSTPFVSGLAALIKSKNPAWSNSLVRDKLEQTTDTISGTGFYFRFGRINACQALDCILSQSSPSPTPSPTPTPTPTPSPTPTPAPTPSPTPTPSPSPSPSVSPTPSPSPSASPKPWWCKYIPTNSYCQ